MRGLTGAHASSLVTVSMAAAMLNYVKAVIVATDFWQLGREPSPNHQYPAVPHGNIWELYQLMTGSLTDVTCQRAA